MNTKDAFSLAVGVGVLAVLVIGLIFVVKFAFSFILDNWLPISVGVFLLVALAVFLAGRDNR